ncbi:integrase family protein [Roseibium sp. TrichSKD4]|nr:integrase family protein [Roseibium sp. TrichSKD4]
MGVRVPPGPPFFLFFSIIQKDIEIHGFVWPTLLKISTTNGGRVAKVQGLVRQGTKYYYRRAVPPNLHPVANKKEVWIALQTSDYHRACRLAREAATATDVYFAELRSGKTRAKSAEEIFSRPISELDLQLAAKRHLWEREKREKTAAGDNVEETVEYLSLLRRAYDEEAQLISSLEEIVTTIVREHFPQIELTTAVDTSTDIPITTIGERKPEWWKLIELVRRAEMEHAQRRLNRAQGGHGDAAIDPLFADIASFAAQPQLDRDEHVSIGTLIDRFLKDPRRSDLTESADKKYIVTFRVLKEVVGADFPVKDVTRRHCAEVQELIAGLPKNMVKLKPYDGLDLRACIALRAKRNDPALSAGSVKVYTQTLSAFFNYAIDRGVLEHNPASRLTLSGGRSERVRRPYKIEHINQILAGLSDWSSEKTISWRYWVPLIAIFSGMRMGEIVSLHVSEVVDKGALGTAFQLTHSADRPLKNKGAERTVPVHPALIDLGLLGFIDQRVKEKSLLLFPDLNGNSHEERAHAFQRRYEYFQKRKLGIRDQGVSFHSFRHNFRDALRECGVPIDTTRALGGWSRGGGIEFHYGEGTSFATLAKWMSKVTYPGLNLVILL